MNPDDLKTNPNITVYGNYRDLIKKEIIDPLQEAGETTKNYDVGAFAKDFSGFIDLPPFRGYYRTFEPSLLISLIQNYATATKLRDLKVGDVFTFNHFTHTLIAKSNVFKDYNGKDSIVVVLLEDGDNYPITFTLSADQLVRDAKV